MFLPYRISTPMASLLIIKDVIGDNWVTCRVYVWRYHGNLYLPPMVHEVLLLFDCPSQPIHLRRERAM